MDFKIAIEQDEDGWYIVTVPALPGCVSKGKTKAEAKKNIAEAIELHLSALARDGIPPYQRPGTKETFVAVDIRRTNPPSFPVISSKQNAIRSRSAAQVPKGTEPAVYGNGLTLFMGWDIFKEGKGKVSAIFTWPRKSGRRILKTRSR
ncbi:MAG: type II toxin-antitoxin system HicB family antitoxin [Methanoregula sp.]